MSMTHRLFLIYPFSTAQPSAAVGHQPTAEELAAVQSIVASMNPQVSEPGQCISSCTCAHLDIKDTVSRHLSDRCPDRLQFICTIHQPPRVGTSPLPPPPARSSLTSERGSTIADCGVPAVPFCCSEFRSGAENRIIGWAGQRSRSAGGSRPWCRSILKSSARAGRVARRKWEWR